MSTPESNGLAPTETLDPDQRPAAEDAEGDLRRELEADGVDVSTSTGLEVAFTPRQILGGFALLAGLILLLRRRSRNR